MLDDELEVLDILRRQRGQVQWRVRKVDSLFGTERGLTATRTTDLDPEPVERHLDHHALELSIVEEHAMANSDVIEHLGERTADCRRLADRLVVIVYDRSAPGSESARDDERVARRQGDRSCCRRQPPNQP